MLGVFDILGDSMAKPAFRGCAFINASAESPPGGAVEEMSDATRAWNRALFIELAREAGATDPDRLGRELAMLYAGAVVTARMDRNPQAAAVAKAMAATLIDAAGLA